ncbi:MAG: septum formation protein Maf [Verrucomicrobia bacterium]|nr:septum formation protein Maf [Verrucomicrobiota bacterium]MBV9274070.1 septum formation protein Maf [Verrucomicrobiota bacterium]
MRGLILASASPRRADLLSSAGYRFSVVQAHTAELMADFLSPRELTLFNARRKAFAVAQRHPESVVMAADTIVALGPKILGKPKDFLEARSFLEQLSGRSHVVVSGVAIVLHAESRAVYEVAHSEVRFRKLTTTDIEHYLARSDPLDKAGGYAAQTDSSIIESVAGSFTNVVGLPMEVVAECLNQFEILPARAGDQ